MVKVTLCFDSNKSARYFMFGWIFQKWIRPAIELRECIWFEVTDDNSPA